MKKYQCKSTSEEVLVRKHQQESSNEEVSVRKHQWGSFSEEASETLNRKLIKKYKETINYVRIKPQ